MTLDGAARLPLGAVLRQGQLRVALAALLVVCTVVTVGAAWQLKASQLHGLELIGRSIAYSTEAAVAFADDGEATRLLAGIGGAERLDSARIVLGDGHEFARYERAPAGTLDALQRRLSPTVELPIVVDGRSAGRLVLAGDAGFLQALLLWAGLGLLFGVAATALTVAATARRQDALVLQPLLALSRTTRSIRQARAFGRRVEPVAVAELDALAGDFNALLDEVQAYEAELVARNEALRQAYETVSQQSRRDALTGVANRHAFEERLDEALSRARREGERVGLLFADADRFKAINDEHGHEAGDAVLCALAARLSRGVRQHDLVARLGGDEFVVLVAPLRTREELEPMARHLEALVREPLPLPGGRLLRPSASLGAAVYPDDGASAAELLAAADRAMYRCKQAGRNRPAATDTPP
ncbi:MULTISPECIES: sensor domain-containing diguanylate cyclase [Rubrivivax]|uniref:Diguanylate cyclase n=1 Tax=Rubrivivax benzoatilyticus TaxID=316997 RepID=A0ABX0HQ00_9BURK|nr:MULTISPECIES: sensor domain-containing diguanylate cyclase [Rubrivivax]EGJ08730.1 GGDEF domain-containing protein [Rubrivivax benzoatilyticus JA2 = ATCC BAA-35]MCD0418741.1 diguanylate cyclase [Rubrivivax sp. JA1024]NHK97147.1 diguanylate cyclase [Rubrivivax benzoatilyticus]NHL23158.1 diguanylate cyclase [Rubrivivax benzoatilyticus]